MKRIMLFMLFACVGNCYSANFEHDSLLGAVTEFRDEEGKKIKTCYTFKGCRYPADAKNSCRVTKEKREQYEKECDKLYEDIAVISSAQSKTPNQEVCKDLEAIFVDYAPAPKQSQPFTYAVNLPSCNDPLCYSKEKLEKAQAEYDDMKKKLELKKSMLKKYCGNKPESMELKAAYIYMEDYDGKYLKTLDSAMGKEFRDGSKNCIVKVDYSGVKKSVELCVTPKGDIVLDKKVIGHSKEIAAVLFYNMPEDLRKWLKKINKGGANQ